MAVTAAEARKELGRSGRFVPFHCWTVRQTDDESPQFAPDAIDKLGVTGSSPVPPMEDFVLDHRTVEARFRPRSSCI